MNEDERTLSRRIESQTRRVVDANDVARFATNEIIYYRIKARYNRVVQSIGAELRGRRRRAPRDRRRLYFLPFLPFMPFTLSPAADFPCFPPLPPAPESFSNSLAFFALLFSASFAL